MLARLFPPAVGGARSEEQVAAEKEAGDRQGEKEKD